MISNETMQMLVKLIQQGQADEAYDAMISSLMNIGFSKLMARKIAWNHMQQAEAIIAA